MRRTSNGCRATAATARSWRRPDITVADLIGEVDPIKVAEGRYLSDELTIHYGMLPRTNRGVFAINELPDLAERIQVGLLNIMEERDVQVRGYKIRLDLDLFVVASANPEDYTNRGRIITPLKDRFGSQIRTHYPAHDPARDRHHGAGADRATPAPASRRSCPDYMKEIIAEVTHLARRSNDISQRSGVSVRVSICNYESMLANALRRSIRLREQQVAPRDQRPVGAARRPLAARSSSNPWARPPKRRSSSGWCSARR